MLNEARVASACFYVRTCRRVRNSKQIATVRDCKVYSFVCQLDYKATLVVKVNNRNSKLNKSNIYNFKGCKALQGKPKEKKSPPNVKQFQKGQPFGLYFDFYKAEVSVKLNEAWKGRWGK